MWNLFGGTYSPSFGHKIASRASEDIGKKEEGGNNRGAFVEGVLRPTGHGAGAPWCAAVATGWINGASVEQFGKNLVAPTASVATSIQDFRNAGAFSKFNGDLSGVKPGDAAFFKRDGGGHMGIVKSVGDGYISLVEGNVSVGGGNADGRGVDGVREGTFSIADLQARNIVGFGHCETRAASMSPMPSFVNMHMGTTSLGSFSSPLTPGFIGGSVDITRGSN